MDNKPRILHISTGGTIAMAKSSDGAFSPLETSRDLIKNVPEVSSFADVHLKSLASLDSANLCPSFWPQLAQAIVDDYDNYDGFVISHGTDTMAYSAAAISFFLQEIDKPIVFTGSQIAMGVIGSDGKRNLINAFRVAVSNISEVVVVFGSKIIRGVRSRKISAFSLEAFESINENPLGEIGLHVRISSSRARKKAGRRLLYNPSLEKNVALFTIYPGFSTSLLEYIIDNYSGVVLLGYGTGNIPSGDENNLVEIIKKATAKGVPVVVGTQCVLGSTNLSIYKVGKSVLDAGAIPSVDMTPESAFVKLMWVLGQTNDSKRVESMMLKSYCGEISTTFDGS
jgi:L-asparaginase